MKKLFVALLFFVALPLRAETVESVPNPLRTHHSWVSDVAQVINPADTLAINRTIEDLQHRTTAEIAVVTVQNTGDDTPKDFATALLNRWKVGKKGKDNGVLVLMVTQTRRLAVETGYGVEGDLPDVKAMGIVNEQAVPKFKQGDYSGGLLTIVQQYAQVLSGDTAIPDTARRSVVPHVAPHNAPSNRALKSQNNSPRPPVYNQPNYNAPNYNLPSSGPFGWIVGILFLMIMPVGGLALIWVIFKLVGGLNTRQCPQCKRPMRYLNEQEDDAFLDEGQRLEERLGGLDWRVWRCDSCNLQHIERSVKFFGGYEDCPRCSHHTLQFESATLRHATHYSEGVRETTRTCRFPDCNYQQRSQEIIPRQQQSNVIVMGGGIGNSYNDSSFGSSGSSPSSSSDTSFSSSSSDFGGGSSGGGGGETGW